MPGTSPATPTPNGNIPKPQARPINPIQTVSGSSPATLSGAILTSPAIATTAHFRDVGIRSVAMRANRKRGPDVAYAGQPLRYEIIVRNSGTSLLHQVHVEDEIPVGVRFLNSEPASETGGNRLSWNLGVLEPLAERRIRVDVQPPGEGELQTRATVTVSGAASLRTLIVQPKLAVAVRGAEEVSVGDTVPFQIQVTNAGGVPIAGLTLRSRFSDGLQHAQGSMIEADIGTLSPGATRTLSLSATAVHGGTQSCDITAIAGGAVKRSRRSFACWNRACNCTATVRRGALSKAKSDSNWK